MPTLIREHTLSRTYIGHNGISRAAQGASMIETVVGSNTNWSDEDRHIGSAGDVAPSMSPAMRTGRIAEVDGLRAIAIGLVMLYHFDVGFPGGFVGVDLFFAISGFVIMRQLLSVDSSVPAKTYLTRFYQRRVLRLVPAALVLCIAMVAASVAGLESIGGVFSVTWRNAVAGLAGVANWFTMTLPSRPSTESTPLQHMWSLSVEEQFYLALPLLLLAFRKRVVLGGAVIGFGAIGIALVTALIQPLPSAGFFNTAARIAPVGAGVLLAVADAQFSVFERLGALRLKAVLLAGLLVALGGFGLVFKWNAKWLSRGGFVVLAIPFVLIVACAAAGGADIVSQTLRHRVFQFVGARSYSLYLWHFPIAFLFATAATPIRTLLRVAISFALAELSYRFVEHPLRTTTRKPLVSLAPVVPPVMLATAVLVTIFGVLRVH